MAHANPTPEAIDATIAELLASRATGKTICPSEAARALAGDGDFRPLMEAVRERAEQLADEGALEITQGGEVVDGPNARGPIRLRLPAPPSPG